jgi:hypothetical protein
MNAAPGLLKPFPAVTFSTYGEFVEALIAAKNYLNLSNQHIEQMFGLTIGQVDKNLGPSRVKNIGPMLFDCYLECLAVRFRMEPNPAAAERMAPHWEGRNASRIRVDAKPLSIAVLRRAKAAIFSDAGKRSAQVRPHKIPPAKRSSIARKAANVRWRRERKRKRRRSTRATPPATSRSASSGKTDLHQVARAPCRDDHTIGSAAPRRSEGA